MAEEHFGEEHATGEDVGTGIRDLQSGLFGGKVVAAPSDNLTFLTIHEVEGLGDAEIGQLHVAGMGKHDVFGADIAMDNPEGFAGGRLLLVGMGEGAGDAGNEEGGEIPWDGGLEGAVLEKELLKVDAMDIFHDDKILIMSLSEMVGLDDVGVDEIGDKFGLADEVLLKKGLAGIFLADDFQGDPFLERVGAFLKGLVDTPHAALRNWAKEAVRNGIGKLPHGAHADLFL